MTTLTSAGAVNLTSSTNWSPAQTPVTGDDLVIGAHTLTLDTDMILNSITFSSASSRMAIGGTTRSVQATNGFEITAAPSNVLISTTLTAGMSVTLTGRWFGNGQTWNFSSGFANSTGGNLTLQTVGSDPSAILFADVSSPNGTARLITASWSGGTLTTIGRMNFANWTGGNTLVTLSGGTWTHTNTGTSYFGAGNHRLLNQSGGVVSITGDIVTASISGSDFFYITGGVSFAYTGRVCRTSANAPSNTTVASYVSAVLVIVSGSCVVNIVGAIVTKRVARACSISTAGGAGSRINWRSQSVSIAADEAMVIYNGVSTVMDLTSLVVANSGRFVYTEQGAATAVVDGSTIITNAITSAQACVVSSSGALDGKVINLASDAPTLPAAEDVAAGSGNYGYSISPITPTGLVVDPAIIAAGVATGLAAYETNGVASQNDLSLVSVDLSGVIGYLTAISDMLPSTPKLAGSADSSGAAVLDSATQTKLDDIETSVDANTGYLTAITSALSALAAKVRKYFQLSLRKDAAIATDNATELGEINANGGTGAGAFANTTDSQEAIRDNLGSGSGGGGGSPVFTAVVVTRIASGTAAGWPEELIIGDAYLTANASAQPLFIKDVADNILSGLGTKLFSDADFVATLRLAPLTDGTRTLDSPPTTIEVKSTDSVGIVYNDDTEGAEYFELQIPRAKTLLGVTKTKYSCQFIMNWGDSNQFERTVNLGEIKFLRKNAPAAS